MSTLSIDSRIFAQMAGQYFEKDMALFEVAGEFLNEKYETWTGPVAFRLVREEGCIVRMEIHDLSGLWPLYEETIT